MKRPTFASLSVCPHCVCVSEEGGDFPSGKRFNDVWLVGRLFVSSVFVRVRAMVFPCSLSLSMMHADVWCVTSWLPAGLDRAKLAQSREFATLLFSDVLHDKSTPSHRGRVGKIDWETASRSACSRASLQTQVIWLGVSPDVFLHEFASVVTKQSVSWSSVKVSTHSWGLKLPCVFFFVLNAPQES